MTSFPFFTYFLMRIACAPALMPLTAVGSPAIVRVAGL